MGSARASSLREGLEVEGWDGDTTNPIVSPLVNSLLLFHHKSKRKEGRKGEMVVSELTFPLPSLSLSVPASTKESSCQVRTLQCQFLIPEERGAAICSKDKEGKEEGVGAWGERERGSLRKEKELESRARNEKKRSSRTVQVSRD